MTQDNVVKFAEPRAFVDPLTEVLRRDARKLLAQAIAAGVSGFLARHSGCLTGEGQQRLVRHGHLPGRGIMTGIGPAGARAAFATGATGRYARRGAYRTRPLSP